MNLIPKICEMLGVEIGEEFQIVPLSGIYRLSDFGLQRQVDNQRWEKSNYITPLLTGQYQIKKIPFEPEKGDSYFYVGWGNGREEISVYVTKFYDCEMCQHHKYCGNIFRTEAEAEKHKFEIYEKLTGRKWEE